jgi:hypothetical protein
MKVISPVGLILKTRISNHELSMYTHPAMVTI